MEFIREIGRRHEALKKRIHATRIPLGPRGRFVMGTVYLMTPVVAGYYVMQAAIEQADQKHEDGAILAHQWQRMDPNLSAQQQSHVQSSNAFSIAPVWSQPQQASAQLPHNAQTTAAVEPCCHGGSGGAAAASILAAASIRGAPSCPCAPLGRAVVESLIYHSTRQCPRRRRQTAVNVRALRARRAVSSRAPAA